MPNARFTALLYHGIGPDPRYGYLAAERLAEQLSWLKARGFAVGGFPLLDRYTEDPVVEPPALCLITFDDGHASALDAIPTLLEYGGAATFFIATKACEVDSRYLGRAGLRKLAVHGDIGSHTVNHQRLTRLPVDRLRLELRDSKAWIEDVIGREVQSFSAPFGDLNRRVVLEGLDAGYQWVGGSGAWWNSLDGIRDGRVVRRLPVDHRMSFSSFRAAVDRRNRFWIPRWLRALALVLPRALLSTESLGKLRRSIDGIRSPR